MGIIESVVNSLSSQNPTAPAAQVAEAVVETISNPSAASIINDIETAISIVKEVKAKMAGLHPSVTNLLKVLF